MGRKTINKEDDKKETKMAVVKRVSTRTADSNGNGNDNNNNHNNGMKIPPVVLGLVLSFVVSFVRARLKDMGLVAKSTTRSTSSTDAKNIPLELLLATTTTSENGNKKLGTHVISNYLSESQLDRLNNSQLWTDCMRLNHQHNQNGILWLDYGATPRTIWEELAVQIWSHHPSIMVHNKKDNGEDAFAGYEFWCNILTPESSLDWHVDKDEVAFQQSNDNYEALKTPFMGAVLYGYPHEFAGGYLEVLAGISPRLVPDLSIFNNNNNNNNNLQEHVERIKADYNRLVFFNVSEWHRVTPLTATTSSTSSRSGSRYTLAVNLWKEKPIVKKGVSLQQPQQQQKGSTT